MTTYDLADPALITTRPEFSAALTQLRERAGLTVRELAKRTDLSASTVGGYLSGRHLPTVSQTHRFRDLLAACGLSDEDDVQAWLAALSRVRTTTDRRLPRPSAPYRGLESFEPGDADRFFGRERETSEILDRLRSLAQDRGPSDGVLAVIGPSGSGKSSVLRAGVVAAIQRGALGEGWSCALAVPGADPLAALAVATAADDPRASGHVLVIDQFEEAFTSVPDAAERAAFLRALAERPANTLLVLGMRADFYAVAAAEPMLLTALQHAQILIGPMSAAHVRDAILRPAEGAGATVEDGLVDLVLADLAPHDSVGQAHDAGGLPLLSHALLATWDRASGVRLSIADYRAAGGIDGAVQRTAEDLFTSLTPDGQELARRMFLRLVHLDDDVAVTRRRASRGELARLEASGGGTAESVVHAFVERRLLTAYESSVEISHEALLTAWPRLRGWVDADRAGLRLHRQITEGANTWSAADRDPSALPRGTRLDARAEWAADSDHRAELDRLELAYMDAAVTQRDTEQRVARRRTSRLRRLFAVATVLAVVAVVLAVFAFKARSTADEQRHVATVTRDLALSRQVAFQARELAAHDPALAEQLSLVAYRLAPTPEAAATIIDDSAHAPITRVLGVQGPTPLGVSRDGLIIAVGHATDGSVHLYRRRDGSAPVPLSVIAGQRPVSQPFAVAFSPDASMVAIGGSGGVVRLWRITDPAHPVAIGALEPALSGAVESIAISPDGRTLAASSDGRSPVLEWDVRDPAKPVSLPAPQGLPAGSTVQSVVFDPSGSRLAAGGGDATTSYVAQWNSARPGRAAPMIVRGDNNALTNSVAYSPDGQTVFAGTGAGTLYVLNARTGATINSVHSDANAKINAVAVSPDGSRIAAGTADDVVYQWSTAALIPLDRTSNPGPVTGLSYAGTSATSLLSTAADGGLRIVAVRAPLPSVGTVYNMNFSADGSRLAVASGGTDRGVQLWNTSDPAHPVPYGPLTAQLTDAGVNSGVGAINADGRLLAAGTKTGKIGLFDLSDPSDPTLTTPPFQVLDAGSLVESVAFSPDGKLLAVAGDDGTVRLVDISTPGAVRRIATMRGGGLMLGVTFSPNGKMVAGANVDDHAYIWDVSNPSRPVQDAKLAFSNYVYSVAFSPDSRRFAAGSSDQTARVWDVAKPTHPVPIGQPLVGATDYVFAVAFSPDGRTLATGSNDGSVRQYSLTSGSDRLPDNTLTDVGGSVFAVAYRPDGLGLLGAGRSQSVASWSTNAAGYAKSLCPLVGDSITRYEWALYVPGAKYDPPCR